LIETEGKRKTQYNINFVKQFPTENGERRSIEEIPAVELNNYLSKFINYLLVVKHRHKLITHLCRSLFFNAAESKPNC